VQWGIATPRGLGSGCRASPTSPTLPLAGTISSCNARAADRPADRPRARLVTTANASAADHHPELAILTLSCCSAAVRSWSYQRTNEGNDASTDDGKHDRIAHIIRSLRCTTLLGGAALCRPLAGAQSRSILATAWPKNPQTSLQQVPGCGWSDALPVSRSRQERGPAHHRRKLGVAHLLEAACAGRRPVARHSQLVRATTGRTVVEDVCTQLRDVFKVQDDIAANVAQALSVKLDAVTLKRAQGRHHQHRCLRPLLRWRQLYLADKWDKNTNASACNLAREAWRSTPGSCWLGRIGRSLSGLAMESIGARPSGCAPKSSRSAGHIAQLAPDTERERERAYNLWGEGKRAKPSPLPGRSWKPAADLRKRRSYANLILSPRAISTKPSQWTRNSGPSNRLRCSIPAACNTITSPPAASMRPEAEYRRSPGAGRQPPRAGLGRLRAHAGSQGRRQ